MDHTTRIDEWRRRLLYCVGGLLAFETLTGVAVYLLPFSVSNQVMVLLHTVAGLAFVLPYAWYQIRHWRLYHSLRWSHEMLTGYFSMVATLALSITGVVLTIQAATSTSISHWLDVVHILATVALIGAAVPHILTPITRAVRARASESAALTKTAAVTFGWRMLSLTAALFVFVVLGVAAYRPPTLKNELPKDYSYVFGPQRPFAPSLARTQSGGAYDARLLGGSASCGRSGCHKQIYDQWSASAHRYAAMDAAFQKIQTVMAKQNGSESTRYCGGCHDPISLFSGTKNIFAENLTEQSGYKEGVSCVACHAIKATDVKGNAAYVISPPKRYMFELDQRPAMQMVSDFLIRAYPVQHVKSLEHKLFKSPEFCAACHKQFIDKEINKVGWVQLQNQYDNWRKSRWNHPGDARRTIECRECHMPLTPSTDPSSGDDRDYNRSPHDGAVRDHRFIAANQFIPVAMHLPGADEQVRLTEKWLRGETNVPEIADKWRKGPAVPIEIVAPAAATAGEKIDIQTVVTNNKVGHDFPTGPLDLIQSWVEVEVTDQNGKVVYQSGQRDTSNFITPGSFIFKAEPVDQYGNLIDRHNLWEMVGVRYRRSVFPGFSDRAAFSFTAPAATELHVTARLLYRKLDQFLINFLFGENSGITAPITVMSEDTKVIRVAAHD
ncbi:MAG TPA: multiheme c-type cytochrome [Gemmatimonadaceae bacterium]|nr:multiheme c-type cytochrome [Gemmatimonadaceae bacterium]